MSKEHPSSTGRTTRNSNKDQQQQQQQRGKRIACEEQQRPKSNKQFTVSAVVASDSEEVAMNMNTTGQEKQRPAMQPPLQQQNSLSMMSNSTTGASDFSMFSTRMDDEDPIFTLDEEVHAKSAERTRHYTADFDPTVSDDDDFPKEIGNLHGGRAYSASNRFPPRVRHSGRSGHLQNTTGIFQQQQQHKLHGMDTGGIGQHLPPSLGGLVPASLPIQITRGFHNWPPRELVGSLSEEEDSSAASGQQTTGMAAVVAQDKGNMNTNTIIQSQLQQERARAKTMMAIGIDLGEHVQQQQQHGSDREDDLYGRMQAYSRSIQPEDDPERIFGERPHRRYSLAMKAAVTAVGGNGTGASSDEAGDAKRQESSGGENIPPGGAGAAPPLISFSTSIPALGCAIHHVTGPGSTSTTTTTTTTGTPRVIVPASLSG